ncbi:MAG TPA: hypothetical protein VGE15_13840 [Sphingobacteriaceae bacterium]
MEPTFTTGQVVFYFKPDTRQYYPAVITAVVPGTDEITYTLQVQAGTGHALRSEEATAAQDSILTFIEFTEVIRQESAAG